MSVHWGGRGPGHTGRNGKAAATASFPVVAFDAATPDIFRFGTATGIGTNGTVGTLALLGFKMAANPAAIVSVFTVGTGAARVLVQILASGLIQIRLRNSTAYFATFSGTTNVCDNASHDILVSWDASDASSATGVKLYIDGVDVTNATAWTTGTIDYATSVNYQFGANVSSGFDCAAFYLNTAARVDITNAANRAKFAPAQIQADGSGPSGAQPHVFLVGNASQWNDAGGINRGSGAKFVKVGSAAVADVSGSAWG